MRRARASAWRATFFITVGSACSGGDQMAWYYADKRKSYPPDIEREPGTEYVFGV